MSQEQATDKGSSSQDKAEAQQDTASTSECSSQAISEFNALKQQFTQDDGKLNSDI